jgi:Tfp pilus assembly protein PilV
MKKYGHSGSSIFLMEIIINILLFSVLLTTSLQLIMKAHTLTQDTSRLHRASTVCANIAECFESGDGTLDSIHEFYPQGSSTGDHLIIYLDEDFADCQKTDAVYLVTVSYADNTYDDDVYSRLTEITITCTLESDTIYSLSACHYEPLTLYTQIGGV